jgi:phage portal protein BeeE
MTGLVGDLWHAVGEATDRFLKARGARKPKSKGEAQLAFSANAGGVYSFPGGQSIDKWEQVRRFRGWQYISGKVIGEEAGMNPPSVGFVRPPEQVTKSMHKRMLPHILRKKSFSSIQPHEEIELADSTHPLIRLLKNPNGPDTSYTFLYRTYLFLELTGEAYWWKIRNGLGEVVELWPLFPQWVLPRPGRDKLIAHYEIRPMNLGWSGVQMFTVEPEDMVAFRYPSPLTLMNGHSPLQSCAEWLDVDEAIESSQWYAFENGTTPGMVIKLDEKVFGKNPISRPDLNRFYADVDQRLGGREKHRKPLVMNPGMEAQPWQNTPQEMDFAASADNSRDRVLAISRVSKTIAGLTDDVKYDNLAGALANFINRTMGPKYTFVGQTATEQLAIPDFGEDALIYYQNNAPPDAAQQNADIERDQANASITPNEQRVLRGREPYPNGGENPMVNGIEMPWVTDEVQMPQDWTQGDENRQAADEAAAEANRQHEAEQAKEAAKQKPEPKAKSLEITTARARVFGKASRERLELLRKGFDPSEPRDEDGKWTKATLEISPHTLEPGQSHTVEELRAKMGPDDNLIEGRIAGFPITTSERGIIQKISKQTKTALESALSDPETVQMMRDAGITHLRMEPHKGPNKPAVWTMAHDKGALMFHSRTAEKIGESTIAERRQGGITRVIHHEAGHGLWSKAGEEHKAAFTAAVAQHPEVTADIAKIVNIKPPREAFNYDERSRAVEEVHSEVTAIRKYAPEKYAAMPEAVRKTSEAVAQDGRKKARAWSDRAAQGLRIGVSSSNGVLH